MVFVAMFAVAVPNVHDVSAASDAKTTTSTKKSTKTTIKKTSLKKKVNKKTVSTKKSTQVSSKTTTNNASKKVVQKTTTVTTVKTTKQNKTQTVETKVAKTVETTTTTYTASGPKTLSGTLGDDVIDAYYQLQFLYEINQAKMKSQYGSSTAGVFSVKDHCLMQKERDQGVLLHEMGHFLAFANVDTANYIFADETSEWNSIYNAEKNAYSGTNKSYYTGSKSEYFAQSVREYFLNTSELKSKRPKTYAYVKEQLSDIKQSNIDWIKKTYGNYWGTKF
jgi:hypothetical protein